MFSKKSVMAGVSALAIFAAAGQAQVVMSQIYGGGGGSGTYREDFVVLFNRGSTPVTLTNAGLFYASATGSFTPASSQRVRLPSPLTLQPGASYLVDTGTPVGTTTVSITSTQINGQPLAPDFIGTSGTTGSGVISAQASNAKIALIDGFDWTITVPTTAFPTATSPTPATGTVVDFVGYGTANNGEGTRAPGLTNSTFLVRNNGGCDDSNDNGADFTAVSVAVSGGNNPIRTSQSGIAICGVPVADLVASISGPGCGTLSLNSPASFGVTLTNSGGLEATASQASIVLPANLTFVSATGGTTSFDSNTRTVSWTVGNLPASGGASTLTVNTTVSGAGSTTVNVTSSTSASETNVGNNAASRSNFVPFSGAGYNAGINTLLVFVPAAYETANGWNAGALGEVTDTLGGAVKVRSLQGRPTASANGNRFIFWTNTALGDAGSSSLDVDGLLVAGSISGNTATYTTIAGESSTIVDTANNRFIRPGVASPQALTAPAINNAGQFAFATQVRNGSDPVNTGTSVVAKGDVATANTFTIVARQGDQVPAAVDATGVLWGSLGATTITSSGQVAFSAQLSGTGITTSNDFALLTGDGTTVAARKGSTPATGMAGSNAGANMTGLNNDLASANGFSVDATGNNVLISGNAILTGTGLNTEDSFVAVNGTVRLQEGQAIPGSGLTDLIDSGTPFEFALMQPDGNWYAAGDFAAATDNGQDWLARNGTIIAKSGDPIATGSTETWADTVVARTFTSVAGNGDDVVIYGLSSNTDRATDNVAVWKNGSRAEVVLREGQPLTINNRQFYVNFVPVNRGQSWVSADRKFYTLVSLFEAANICANDFPNTVSALISIDLPTLGPVACGPSDIAGPGQTLGFDGQLTADDIIVFIGFFFNADARADVGSSGQVVGADGQFTADDIIIFINRFFTGC
jgi:hypothetical protein